jgi:hypothetical protein
MSATQVFSLAVTTLGAGVAAFTAGPPATAAAAEMPAPYSACHAFGGSYQDQDGGGWHCQYPVPSGAEQYDPALTAGCGTVPTAYVIADTSPTGSITFYCPPPLIN